MTRKVVYKYPLPVTDHITVTLPEGAVPLHTALHTALQHGQAMLWALVDATAPPELRRFRLAGTGHPIEDTGRYIGTLHVEGLVFHLFEESTP